MIYDDELLKKIFSSFNELEETLEKCYDVLAQNYIPTTKEQDEAFASLWFNIRGIKDNLEFLEGNNHGKR